MNWRWSRLPNSVLQNCHGNYHSQSKFKQCSILAEAIFCLIGPMVKSFRASHHTITALLDMTDDIIRSDKKLVSPRFFVSPALMFCLHIVDSMILLPPSSKPPILGPLLFVIAYMADLSLLISVTSLPILITH